MKERPILFSSDMIKAILDGRKTQTRRVIKPQPIDEFAYIGIDPDYPKSEYHLWLTDKRPGHGLRFCIKCPYGVVGDRLWVREVWRCTGGGDLRNIIYRAEGDSAMSFCGIDDGRAGILHVPEPHWAEWDRLVYETNKGCNWRSPIFMPKWAARIRCEITGIRVERVQELSISDCVDEGIQRSRGPLPPCPTTAFKDYSGEVAECGATASFRTLWDSLNGKKKGSSWSENPWCWCIEFKRVREKL